MKKMGLTIKTKISLTVLMLEIVLSIILIVFSIYNNEVSTKKLMGEKILGILNTAKFGIDGDKFENIAKSRNESDEYYEELRKNLIKIKEANELKYLYTVVKNNNEEFVYIVDGNEKESEGFSKIGDVGKVGHYYVTIGSLQPELHYLWYKMEEIGRASCRERVLRLG